MVTEAEFMKQQQDQVIENDPNAGYAQAMREDKANNILSQINPDNLLSDIEHRIRGDRKDAFTGEWVKVDSGVKKINSELVGKFISFLGCILNQNTSMSNFTPKEINNIMQLIISWLSKDLRTNSKKYGIEKQYSEWDRICHIVLISCFAVFKRALNGQESKRLFKVISLTQKDEAEKKGGWREALKFW